MFIDIKNLPYTSELGKGASIIGYSIRGIIAVESETQAELHYSHARRKYGRATRYFVLAPDGGTIIHYFKSERTLDNPHGKSSHLSYSRVFVVTAYTDTEAIEKANKLFPQKFEKFKAEVYHEYVREEGKDFGQVWWQREEGLS